MHETIVQNATATLEALQVIISKYNLPKEDVLELFSQIYKENMRFKKD